MKISTIQFKPSQNFTYHFLLAFALALLAFTSQASAQSYLVNQITNTSAGNITINVPKNTTSSIYSTAVYQTGILQQWKLLSIFAIMITLLVVALAYTFAIAFNTRELKAWADVEMGQVFVSAILVMGLLGTISFLDGLSEAISYNSGLTVDGSNPCDGITIPCSMRLAQIYLDDLLSVAKATGFDLLKKNIDYTNWASTSVGLSCDSMYCIWASGSYRPNAGYSMATDKYTLLFDDVSKITASLRAQRYFLDVISYSLGPILLLLGIVFRSLWFARKLGGLLLAVAVSLMVLYPLLYVFSWYTLKVATYGDAAFPQNLPPTCPSECQLKPPVNSTTVPGSTCDSLCPGVPSACREIPYPYQLAGACNETAWNQCPADCKISRIRTDGCSSCLASSCPSMCKAQFPMANDCSDCEGLPYYCRVKYNESDIPKPECTSNPRYAACKAVSGCMLIIPNEDLTNCEKVDACKVENTCPTQCRVNFGNAAEDVPVNGTTCAGKCVGCPSWCKASPPVPPTDNSTAPAPRTDKAELNNCAFCPLFCRFGSNAVDTEVVYGTPYPKAPLDTDPDTPPEPKEPLCFENDTYSKNACSPTYCQNACRTEKWAPTCAPYVAGGNGQPCSKCDYSCRVSLTFDGNSIAPAACSNYSANCAPGNSAPACVDGCLQKLTIPSDATCQAFVAYPNILVKNSSGNPPLAAYPGNNTTNVKALVDPTQAIACKTCPTKCRYGNTNNITECNKPIVYEDPSTFTTSNTPAQCNTCNGNPAGTNSNSCFCNTSNPAWGANYVGDAARKAFCDAPTPAGFADPCRCDASSNCNDATYTIQPRSTTNICSSDFGICPSACFAPVRADSNICKDYAGLPAGQKNLTYVNAAGRQYCQQCPKICRIGPESVDICSTTGGNMYDCTEAACPLNCRFTGLDVPAGCKLYVQMFCEGCPLSCRVLMPDGSLPPGCSDFPGCNTCPKQFMAAPPKSVCGGCNSCEDECSYEPPIRKNCGDLCGKQDEGPIKFSPSNFVTRGGVETQNVGTLAVPAIALPLFNIVIIIAFVRVLSPLLGGDIDIPGLSKII